MSLRRSQQGLELAERLRKSGEYERAVRILARTIFRLLAAQGYEPRHVIQLSSELLSQVTLAVRSSRNKEALPPVASTSVYQESA